MTLKTYKNKTETKPFTQEQIKALIDGKRSIEIENKAPTEEKTQAKKITPSRKPPTTQKKDRNIRLMFELSKQEPTEHAIEQLAEELYEWGKNDKALSMEGFCVRRMILYKTFIEWVKKYPILKYSYEMAQMAIGVRLHMLALIKGSGANESFIMRILHQYSDEWREAEEYHDGRKIKIEKAKSNISNNNPPKEGLRL